VSLPDVCAGVHIREEWLVWAKAGASFGHHPGHGSLSFEGQVPPPDKNIHLIKFAPEPSDQKFTIISPILIGAPGYFGDHFSFGTLMMAVGAFVQVQQSLRWFIDNFSTIADWRATLLSLRVFYCTSRFIVIDEAFDAMEEEARKRVISLLNQKLKNQLDLLK
jgi:hypothetical protein